MAILKSLAQGAPAATTIVFATLSWIQEKWKEDRMDDFEKKRKILQRRMLHAAGVKAVEGWAWQSEHVSIYILYFPRVALHGPWDRDGLDNWRGYYRRHLHPFDLQIQERIRVNADCIRPEDMEIIQNFVQHVALHQYRMEHWRDGDKLDMMADFDDLDWIAQHNNIDFLPYKALTERVNKVYVQMKEEREKLDDEMSEFSDQRLFQNYCSSILGGYSLYMWFAQE